MALFKVLRGDENNLPVSKNDGWAYFCADTGNFYIDHLDSIGNLIRTRLNSNCADKMRYLDGNSYIEINAVDIANAIKEVYSHTHTKSQITDFPSSLPADGGDADTVDGKHASDFATAADVADLKSKVGNVSVSDQISAAIENLEPNITEEEIPNLYIWEKLKAEHATSYEVVETDVANVRIGYKLSYKTEWDEVKYADSYELQGDKITLINPTTIRLDEDNRDVIKGKYICLGTTYYKIPSTAKLSSHSGTIYKEILVDNAKKLIVNSISDTQETRLGYVSSKSFNTYPTNGEHTDGYWYKYIKQLGDSAIVDGSSVNFTETDPTVPAWAKSAEKPTYTASEVGALPSDTKYAGSSSAGGAATSANKLNTNAGSATQPVYFENGVPVATTHTLGASVPSDAKFTDTIYFHPIYSNAKENGFYKVTVDDEGHVSNTVAVSKNDITALGLTASDIGALPASTAIPTKLSDLAEDSTHRTVTDTEKSTWNAKANASDIPTVPTKVSAFENDKGYLTQHQSLSGYAKTSDIPTNVSELTNDKGYITGYTETDPTVPAWAKAANKPGYTASEVGLGNVDNVKQYSASNPPPYPVTKVNGQTGDVTIDIPQNAVVYTEQALTSEQKAQARANIGALSKSNLYLGIHTDGLIYLFVDGVPVGNGIQIATGGDIVGYVDSENNIVVSGNLADGAYTVKYEMEDGSTIDIGNLVLDRNVYYSVTNNLTNCVNSNSASEAIGGTPYSATITANSGYELSSVNVTMGGTDISSTAVSGGTITITSVTGNIVITAAATEIQTVEPTNFCVVNTTVPSGTDYYADTDPASPSYGWISGGRCSSTGVNRTDSSTTCLTNYIPVQNGDVVYVKGLDMSTTAYSGIYKSDYTAIKGFVMTTSSASGYAKDIDLSGEWEQFTIDNANAGFIRICGSPTGMSTAGNGSFFTRVDMSSLNIIINIKRNGEWLTSGGSENYTNLLPLSVDANGNDYVGTNGEDGYKSGYKMSTTSGDESSASGAYCSGFIPVSGELYNIIRIKNIELSSAASVNNIVFYNADKTKINGYAGTANAFTSNVECDNGIYSFALARWFSTSNVPAFFRFSCAGISADTIVTENEEI